jgi:hypothetical protein
MQPKRLRLLFILGVSRDVVLVCGKMHQTGKCYHIHREWEVSAARCRQPAVRSERIEEKIFFKPTHSRRFLAYADVAPRFALKRILETHHDIVRHCRAGGRNIRLRNMKSGCRQETAIWVSHSAEAPSLKTKSPLRCSGLSSNFATSRKSGAGEGIRTLDPDLGKVVLYH